ncbi:hypothetical protein BDV19DRAFT_387373 [Aspergillus venezuelensis]
MATLNDALGHNLEILELLLRSSRYPKYMNQAMRVAAVRNNKAAIEILPKHGYDLEVYGFYPLIDAIKHEKMPKLLICSSSAMRIRISHPSSSTIFSMTRR